MIEQLPPPTPPRAREQPGTLDNWRCYECGRLLARVDLAPGSTISIKCRCGQANVRQVLPVIDSEPPAV